MVSNWKDFDTAPRDGSEILACRDTGCGWEYRVVWWNKRDTIYPWDSDNSAYPEGRFDYWTKLESPYD